MAHEERNPRSSNGRLSKKLKNKKVPQRGMGVAQLEMIISQEQQQQKNDVAILKPNSINFRPPPSIPLPPPLPPNHHHPPISTTDATNPNSISRIWIGRDHNFSGENPNPNKNQVSTTITQRSQLFQQQCSLSKMELPSNQIYCSNNYPLLMWSHEEKMVGMKRAYPFSMENMPIPSFNFKFPFPMTRSNESASCSSNGCTTGLEFPTPLFREKNNSSLVAKDFLTLAPPRSSSKEKLAPLSIREPTLPQHQDQTKDPSRRDWSNRKPLYSFFPAAKNSGNNNGEEGVHVDLNLKL